MRKNKKEGGATSGKVTHWGRGRAYLAHHRSVFFDSLLRLLRTPFSSCMTWLVIGIALALPTGLYEVLTTVQSFSHRWGSSAQISIYLKSDIQSSYVNQLQEQLKKHPIIAKVDSISPEQALAEFQSASGFGEVINQLESNPLPAVLVIHPNTHRTDEIKALYEELSSMEGVDKAQIDLAWVERLFAIMELVKRTTLFLAGLLGVGVVLVIANTLRLTIENRREEIYVVHLVGGTDAFIRRPFLYLGFWYGLGGALVAWALIEAGLYGLRKPLDALLKLYQTDFQLTHLHPESIAVLLAGGILLGWLSALMAAYRYLREATTE